MNDIEKIKRDAADKALADYARNHLEAARDKLRMAFMGNPTDFAAYIQDARARFDDGGIARLLFDLVFANELQVHTYSVTQPTQLLSTAKKLKIDPEKIRRELQASAKPQPAAKAKKAKGAKR